MREIKFRAWDNILNEYFSWGDSVKFNNYHDLIEDNYNGAVSLEQYTGLKDKNGVEIYEGDIVQPVRFYEGFERFPKIEPTKIGLPLKVNFGNYVFGKWIAREVNETGFGVNDYHFSEELQVIGNIHENPELLEEQS
ncbi:YopX family protein [Leuconostoc mesenteroides]|uniref:YopX family protein n=1 Tax=Leuconostoc mesenteroides TaxID=1245 RepID=UPI0023613F19|nr:YopX family protein [Leuconostoc mesenteroides]